MGLKTHISNLLNCSPNHVPLHNLDFGRLNQDGLNELSRDYLRNTGEAYALYAWLTTILPPGKIVDVGTLFGTSALSLTYSGHQVISYDIHNVHEVSNPLIEFRVENLIEDWGTHAYIESTLKETVAVLIDVDPHDGIKEKALLELVRSFGWHGPILFDDIHLNRCMEFFWGNVSQKFESYDLTAFGHKTGTGIIFV